METIIKNGWIINSDDSTRADLRIVDSTIAEIGNNLVPSTDNTTLIDATNQYLIPGGIDPHVHLHLPTPAGFSSDNYITGSRAALMGGTTTLIDFVTPKKNQSLVEALENRIAEARNCVTDYSFHVSPVDWHHGIADELRICKNTYGITSFKVYMAYKNVIGIEDNALLEVMKTVATLGGLVTVHAEMGDDIEILRNQLADSGNLSPKYHPQSRPAHLETEAVEKAIQLAMQAHCPLYIVHLSAKSSLEAVKKARRNGANVLVETCPQYLLLDESKYEGEFNETSKFVISPPLRKPSDLNALWQGLADGSIQTIGTDHCPFSLQQKSAGINDFRLIPNGAGGVEYRLQLLFSEGVLKNRITLNQWVQLCSTNAAKIFGLFPAKGIIAVGSDADVVIWNPKTLQTISAANQSQNCDLNIYEGFSVTGSPEIVIKSGQIVMESGSLAPNLKNGTYRRR